METVIRSPQDGVVKKLAHKEGVSFDIIALFMIDPSLSFIILTRVQ